VPRLGSTTRTLSNRPAADPCQHPRELRAGCRTGGGVRARRDPGSLPASASGLGPRLVHMPSEPSGSQRSPALHHLCRSQVRSCRNEPGRRTLRMRYERSAGREGSSGRHAISGHRQHPPLLGLVGSAGAVAADRTVGLPAFATTLTVTGVAVGVFGAADNRPSAGGGLAGAA
jgi:hypothetical protein